MEELLFIRQWRFLSAVGISSVIVALGSLVPNHAASAALCYCQDDGGLEVGDLVEFDFLGDTCEGEVTRFTRAGWPFVEFEYRGRSRERFFPTNDVKLIERASSSSDEPDPAIRTWTDTTGAFEVKARLLSYSNGKIELEKEDGRVVTLPLDKLSKPDQEFIAEIEKKAADETNSDNPFAGGIPAEGRKPGAEKPEAKSPFESSGRFSNKTRGNSRNRSRNTTSLSVGIEPEFGGNEVGVADLEWKVNPDARTAVGTNSKIIGVPISGRNAFRRIEDVFADPSGKSLVVLAEKSFTDEKTIFLANLATGKAIKRTISEKRADLFAGSHDGKLVVTKKDRHGDVTGGLQFWDTTFDEPKLVHTWKTADFFDRKGFEPEYGAMLENGLLLTFGRRIVLWDIETASDAYTFDIPVDAPPAFSPGGKQYAVASGEKIYIVETATGKTLGALEIAKGAADSIAFSDSGQFLAAGDSSGYETIVWDLSSGQKITQFYRAESRLESLDWVGDEHILVNKKQLFDVALKSVVWNFTSDSEGKLVKAGNGNFYYASSRKFTPIKLLSKRLKEQTARLDPDELLALKPGDKVSIDLTLPFSRTELRSVRNKLKAMLREIGFVISDKAPNALVIAVKKQKRETVELSSIHDPFGRRGSEEISYYPSKVTISLNKDGDSVWKRQYTRTPGHVIHANRGESYQQAANRMCKVKPSEIGNLRLPTEIRIIPDDIKGNSKITSVGIQ